MRDSKKPVEIDVLQILRYFEVPFSLSILFFEGILLASLWIFMIYSSISFPPAKIILYVILGILMYRVLEFRFKRLVI